MSFPEHVWSLMLSKPGFATDEGQWVGRKLLGEGGQGCAGLFTKLDPTTKKILDRMVVKETRSVTKWDDEYQFFGPKKEFPREHYMSLILPKDSNNTINIIGSRLFPDRGTFRLYMEYCPAGDLADLLHSYRDRSLIFPEPYLWKVFQDLARAVYAMDNPSGHGLEEDDAIAHIDFKPSNIFLCLPDENNFPKYPVAKLADFGGAMICSPRDTEKIHAKKVHSGAFTPGYVAPDVERYWKNPDADRIPARDTRPGVTDVPKRVTTATNIWNAAMIIADLMSPQPFILPQWRTQAYTARDAWLDNFVNQRDTHPIMQGYSALLKDTVIQCLNYIPDQRPTPTALLATVDQGVNLHSGIMQTKTCLDTTKYTGQYDLTPSAPFLDKFPVEQSDDWDMADDDDMPIQPPGGGGPTPNTPGPQGAARRSKTATAGAPQDTPFKGFVVGPNAGNATRNFFDDADEDYERVEKSAPHDDFINSDALRQALGDEMMDS